MARTKAMDGDRPEHRSLERDAEGHRDPHYERHGYTAEDADGVGHGEEGFLAEEYPGHNPMHGESSRELQHRETYTWRWPRPDPDAPLFRSRQAHADWRICEEIGKRILRAESDLSRVALRVRAGVVVVEGEVDTLDVKYVVEGLAKSVQGVRRVRSSLVVRDDPTGTRAGPSRSPRP